MESIVKVEHLSHRYTVDWAIQDINFEVNRKGILGLLGSNGAGKSTTMNIICGVLNQTDGTVYITVLIPARIPWSQKKYRISYRRNHPCIRITRLMNILNFVRNCD